MELFSEKRGDVDQLATGITTCPRLWEPLGQNDRRNRHISSCEREDVQDVAAAAVSCHWQYPQRDLTVRAGLLVGGEQGCHFLSYRELSALRRSGDQSGRVLVLRYCRLLPWRTLLAGRNMLSPRN